MKKRHTAFSLKRKTLSHCGHRKEGKIKGKSIVLERWRQSQHRSSEQRRKFASSSIGDVQGKAWKYTQQKIWMDCHQWNKWPWFQIGYTILNIAKLFSVHNCPTCDRESCGHVARPSSDRGSHSTQSFSFWLVHWVSGTEYCHKKTNEKWHGEWGLCKGGSSNRCPTKTSAASWCCVKQAKEKETNTV